MADLDIAKFAGMVFAVIVALILVVVVGIPIISSNQVAESVPNAAAINSIIGIIPILLIVAILMAIVGTFLVKKYKN